jgi:formiminotetrahydrofolate cyclodeaminase
MLTSLSVTNFLDETASNSPAPGGGSVSALAASLGAALTSMVCRLTIGKKKYVAVQHEMEAALISSEKLRAKFTALIDEDTTAFRKVMAAFGLPKETNEQNAQRIASIQEATKEATVVPLRLMELCAEAIEIVKIVVEKGNPSSLSDTGVAVLMLKAACEGAALNIHINLSIIQDAAFIEAKRTATNTIRTSMTEASQHILYRINKKLLL